MNPRTDCANFSGSKPCGLNADCDRSCTYYKRRGKQILLIHLGALGAVVRSTALLNSIHRKYPGSQITWVTQSPAHNLLINHPQISRILTTSENDLLALSVLRFDVALVIDKSLEATGVLRKTFADEVYGFLSDEFGRIFPANPGAYELWKIGISDHIKFKINQKTELELLRDALALDKINDDYNLPLSEMEKNIQYERSQDWSEKGKKIVIGINTGCAATIPAKKLSIENQRELIRLLQKNKDYAIVLLGGPEDTVRNAQILEGSRGVIASPTTMGLRDGLTSIAACDIVVTGDSLGMHMAISQKKGVVAWFGPTCSQEIELYNRGEKVISQASCGPCWKRSCHKPVMCYDLVNLDEIIRAVSEYANKLGDSNRLFGRSTSRRATFELDEKTLPRNSIGADLS